MYSLVSCNISRLQFYVRVWDVRMCSGWGKYYEIDEKQLHNRSLKNWQVGILSQGLWFSYLKVQNQLIKALWLIISWMGWESPWSKLLGFEANDITLVWWLYNVKIHLFIWIFNRLLLLLLLFFTFFLMLCMQGYRLLCDSHNFSYSK